MNETVCISGNDYNMDNQGLKIVSVTFLFRVLVTLGQIKGEAEHIF